MFPYQVKRKIIISGDYVEVFKYSKPYWVGWPKERKYRPKHLRRVSTKSQTELRDDNVKRTRKKLKRLINSNAKELIKFLTLTFAENVSDFNIANKQFKDFILRLNYKYPNFKYVAVPEFQKRGAIHYHLLCNLPYLPVSELEGLRKVWGQGWIDLKKIDKVENVGAYISKYLGKTNFDKRFFRKKKFFHSANLSSPRIIDRIEEYREFQDFLKMWTPKQELWKTTLDTKWLGGVSYEVYKL